MTTAPLADLPPSVDTLVIGAGQAGLAAAWYLVRGGMQPDDDLLLVDRGPGTGGAWQHRWEALRLDDAHRVHDLPGMSAMGMSFAEADGNRPARDIVAEYYARYEREAGLHVRRPVTVRRVEYRPEGFAVTLVDALHGGTASVTAQTIVNASGTWGSPVLPELPGRDSFTGRQLHTASYVSAEELRGQRVAVVGGGASGIGFLVELEGVARETAWFTRRPVEFLLQDELDRTRAIAAVAEQDRAARAGEVLPSIVSGTGMILSGERRRLYEAGRLRPEPLPAVVEPGGLRRADGSLFAADTIIWATGFRAELDHLAPLGVQEESGGWRVADGRLVREPRIFLAGYGPQASTIGANRAGRQTATAVLTELGRRAPHAPGLAAVVEQPARV